MCRQRAVGRHYGPIIVQDTHRRAAHIYHGLDGDRHAPHQAGPVSRPSVVRHLRIFVHFSTYAVTDVLPYDRKAVCFDVFLNRVGDVRDPVAFPGILDAFEKALPGHGNESFRFLIAVADDKGRGAVSDVTVLCRTHIDAHDIAVLQHPFAWYAVDELVVHRDADACRITVITKKRGNGTL